MVFTCATRVSDSCAQNLHSLSKTSLSRVDEGVIPEYTNDTNKGAMGSKQRQLARKNVMLNLRIIHILPYVCIIFRFRTQKWKSESFRQTQLVLS